MGILATLGAVPCRPPSGEKGKPNSLLGDLDGVPNAGFDQLKTSVVKPASSLPPATAGFFRESSSVGRRKAEFVQIARSERIRK